MIHGFVAVPINLSSIQKKKTNHIYQQKKTNYIDKKNKKNPTKNFTTIIRIHQKTITKSRHKKIGMMRLMIGMMFFSVD